MKIAVIADIHSNAAALEAVLDDIAARGVSEILCLGDCASGLMWPRATMTMLMDRNIASVRGNGDRWIIEKAPSEMGRPDAFAHAELTPDQLQWLAELPKTLTRAPGVLACHGTPDSDVENLLDEPKAGFLAPASCETVQNKLSAAGRAARVVLCGHSHLPSMMQLPGGPLVLNPGSVGLTGFRVAQGPQPHISQARAPQARYAILTLDDARGDSVDLIALKYDWESAAQRAEANGAAAWAYELRTGFVSPVP